MKVAGLRLVLLLGVCSGCGWFLNGPSQGVIAESDPPGAEVRTDARSLQFWTPTSLWLSRKHGYLLAFDMPGYDKATVEIRRETQGHILALDILFTAGAGAAFDALTGALYRLTPETAFVTLTKLIAGTDGPERVDIVVRVAGRGRMWIESSRPVRVQARGLAR
ncbi:MAG: hypothetical protein HY560_03580 [Gemmatimonadetes bacterium]|nr:hypothetical protein [Gemmatimonadota bacterium]